MSAHGSRWQRPTELPPWFAALMVVGGVLLTISLLPSFASAITPDGAADAFRPSGSVSSAEAAVPAGEPSSSKPAAIPRVSSCAPAKEKPTPTPSREAGDTAKTYGIDPSKLVDKQVNKHTDVHVDLHAALRSALEAKRSCVHPLPKSGADADRVLLAAVLLAAGLGLLFMIGFSTERPWPGRYVRRFR